MEQQEGQIKQSLPKGWLWVRHDEIAEINPKLPENENSPNLVVSFIPMRCVGEATGKLNLSEKRDFCHVKKGYTPFINGDLIFAKITPCMENGKLAILNGLINGVGFGSTEFHVSRLTKNTNVKYLYYYFLQKAFRRDAQQNMTGSAGQLRVPSRYFQKIFIPLSPLPEQHRMVAKIEELFSDLDKGIEQLKTVQQQLKVYRQAVLKWAIEGKLTEKWRKTHDVEPAEKLLEQIKEEREKQYQQQLKDWQKAIKEWEAEGKKGKQAVRPRKNEYYTSLNTIEIKELPQLPKNWCWEKAGNLCQSIVPNRDKPKSFSGKIPWLTTPDIDDEKISINTSFINLGLSDDEVIKYNARVIPKDSTIMTCVGTFGITCVATEPVVINQQLHALVTHQYIEPRYLAYSIKYQKNWMETKATSTTVSYLNKTNCNSIPISICSMEEQHQIVQEIETRLSVCDNIEANIEESLQKAEALRQSILKKAFKGKLVPQDPNDEPANVLLERIKAEKARHDTENKKSNNRKKEKAL